MRSDAGMDHRESPEPAPPPARAVTERLFESRTVLLFGSIDMELAQQVAAQLLALAAASAAPIRLVINSPGGHVESGDTLHDTIRFIDAPVHVIGTGWVASAAALVYAAAEREHRVALPNTRFLLHQPLGGADGRASDVEIEAQQILAIRERVARIMARATGQSVDRIKRDTQRNYWLTAEQAQAYGLVHRIVTSARELDPPR